MNSQSKSNKPRYIAMLAVAGAALAIWFLIKLALGAAGNGQNLRAEFVQDADVVIPLADVSENALFYPASVDGIEMELIAVKAPDKTVRTVFNTCQVCFSSGRGYYVQKGDKLVCENCGNRFAMADVGISHGGCNPVPIPEEYKTQSDSTITVPLDTLNMAKSLFAVWKR